MEWGDRGRGLEGEVAGTGQEFIFKKVEAAAGTGFVRKLAFDVYSL